MAHPRLKNLKQKAGISDLDLWLADHTLRQPSAQYAFSRPIGGVLLSALDTNVAKYCNFGQVSGFMAHRRFSSRVETKNDLWVYWEGSGDRDLSRVKDLSIGGLFILTPRPKRIGSTTNLHFLVQEGQIRAAAVVRHVKPGGGLGLKFNAVNEKDRPNLAALMRRIRSLS